jgi:hypothetical protein
MAVCGEGHCRTLSSCLAPFLWTFADVLALDPHDSYFLVGKAPPTP